MQIPNKSRPPVPSSMDVCDLVGGSGPPRIPTGGARNRWVKKNHHTWGERLKMATYNDKNTTKRLTRARTGRKTERKQYEMGRDRARRSQKKSGKFHNSPKWPPAVPL